MLMIYPLPQLHVCSREFAVKENWALFAFNLLDILNFEGFKDKLDLPVNISMLSSRHESSLVNQLHDIH